MQSKYLLHQDSDALLMAPGPTHNTKSGENVHLTLCNRPCLVFLSCFETVTWQHAFDCNTTSARLSVLWVQPRQRRGLGEKPPPLTKKKARAASLLVSRMIPVQSLPSQPHPNCCSPSLMGGKKQPQQTKLQAHGETDKQRLRSSPYRQEPTKCEHPFSGEGCSRLAPPSGRLGSCCSMQTLGSSSEFPRGPTVLGTHGLDAAHTAQIVEINTFKDKKHLGLLVVSGFLAFSPLCAAPCN